MIHPKLPSAGVGLIGVLALAAAACSSTPPPKSARDIPTVAPVAQNKVVAPPSQSSPTTTTVAIDDAILRACNISADKAYFPFDSARLESSDVRPLDAVATCFRSGPLKGRSLKLVGRADPRGDDEYNMVLGQSRADSVGAALVRDGLTRSRMTSTSRGDLDAKGRDENGWSLDRRVDVLLGS
ncbi:MAG TPA: OmpA family protein [Polyangiaceae bacterium]|jgi:peptidoglycan-associated lipoprotein|nr:OmpA family protein [Polyangiaceae bacterium]